MYRDHIKLVLTLILGVICSLWRIQETDSLDYEDEFIHGTFPEDFEWGFATASYQVEGGKLIVLQFIPTQIFFYLCLIGS